MKEKIIKSLRLKDSIYGHTHKFYNYPARFHPAFAKSVIETFTNVGDCIIDPFMGSGTTGVEALGCGRKFLGVDINPLSTFLSTVKMTPLTKKDFVVIKSWTKSIPNVVNLHDKIEIPNSWLPYVKKIPWWLRKTIAILLKKAEEDFDTKRQIDFIRCGILGTGQWALDCKRSIPSSKAFIEHLQLKLYKMVKDLQSFQVHINQSLDVPLSQIHRRRKILFRPIIGIEQDIRVIRHWIPAKLILTSPPYPGVHVVYNRWQIHGRKETPAPYWIINSPDGNGLSFYTLGDRKQKGLTKYFQNLKVSYESIKHLMDRKSLFVQLVGFSDPSWQLGKFLEVMSSLGFKEVRVSNDISERYCRRVPNRKWYTQYKDSNSYSDREFLLIHKIG